MSKSIVSQNRSGSKQHFYPNTIENRLPVPSSYTSANGQGDCVEVGAFDPGIFYHRSSEAVSADQLSQIRSTPSPFYPLPVDPFIPSHTPSPTGTPSLEQAIMELPGLASIPETSTNDESTSTNNVPSGVKSTPKKHGGASHVRNRGLSVSYQTPIKQELTSPQSVSGVSGIYSPIAPNDWMSEVGAPSKAWSTPSARQSVRSAKPRSSTLDPKELTNSILKPFLGTGESPTKPDKNAKVAFTDPFHVEYTAPADSGARENLGGVPLPHVRDSSATTDSTETSEFPSLQNTSTAIPSNFNYGGVNQSLNPGNFVYGGTYLPSQSGSETTTTSSSSRAREEPVIPGGLEGYASIEALLSDQRQLPVNSIAYRKRARALANYIKSGFLPIPPTAKPDPVPQHGGWNSRRFTRSTEQTTVAKMPAVPIGTKARPPGLYSQPDPVCQMIIQKGGLDWNDIEKYLPFVDVGRHHVPTNAGVVRISEIPYTTIKSEIIAFLGSRALILPQPKGSGTYGIHIIMDRATAKSLDCFVEFVNQDEARSLVDSYKNKVDGRRPPRIGDRPVKVTLSSQSELMKELFPKAKNVTWTGQKPIIHPPEPGFNGFSGFTSQEETYHLVKFAEYPARSRFSAKHLQRPYESMISLLAKFPWWESLSITLGERDRYYQAVLAQMKVLVDMFHRGKATSTLSPPLLLELLHVALSVPVFSEDQRATLIDTTSEFVHPPVYVTAMAHFWPFEVFRRREDAHEQLVIYFAGLLKFAASTLNGYQAPTNLAFASPFGNFAVNYPADKESRTLGEIAAVEHAAIMEALGLVIGNN